jgi:hypothetical protein
VNLRCVLWLGLTARGVSARSMWNSTGSGIPSRSFIPQRLWDSHEVSGSGLPEDVDAWVGEIDEFYQDGFIPSLESMVELGLQVIKYDAPDLWLGLIVDTLIDTFETCRRLDRLRSGLPGATRAVLPFTRPAYEVYVGVRTLATYAVARRRFAFLAKILPKLVRFFTLDNLSPVLVPIVFWPFAGSLQLPDMRGGRNRTLWAERIESAWASYFGTPDKVLSAAYQLEFILEFNSYIFEVVKPEGISRLEDPDRKRYFGTNPISGPTAWTTQCQSPSSFMMLWRRGSAFRPVVQSMNAP